jgi:hypothetical protein
MDQKQTIYFMTLVGGLAGLLCWSLVVWIPGSFQLAQESFWLVDVINLTLFGALIGGLTVGFADGWSGDRILARWVFSGLAIGFLCGSLSGISQAGLSRLLATESSLLSRSLSWMVAGGLIGWGAGLRWITLNKRRALHALLGGMGGGALGGAVFASLGSGIPDVSQAVGFMLTGMGITSGVTLAPVLMRDGILTFMTSEDPRATKKYGSHQKQWELQNGDRYVVGSLGADQTLTIYAQEVQVFIPDAQVAPRHAILSGRHQRFFVDRHPESIDSAGQFVYSLSVNGSDVEGPRELTDGDLILVGQTCLRFQSKRRPQR